ncbi:inner centromere protein [Plutella xylostella]|uniref:inner centromere protein n=1 Tax=Plutella xylostella TaxID=51655 RepID=UPI002032DC71|nr:inner centromere protein [Plutella xylostella]
MPAATTTAGEEQNDADQKMWNALKRYIIRERQRKKEEYEAEVEEERLRKEREARERQDVMTLEETKEQIEQLEQKLKQLEKEKQKLFMQLKKLLNEDEVRKRQQQKESNEMQPMKMGGMGGNMQMPMFSSMPSSGQGEPPPQGRGQPNDNHMMNKQPMGVQGVKRQRSPSPTYPHNMYPHRHQPPVKHQTMYTDHKLEDGRRQLTARVLWNKPHSQYSNVGGTASSPYYCMSRPAAPRPPPLLYAPHPAHPLLYAPPQQPLYMDVNNKHDPNKDKPQVLIGLSEAHHAAVSGGAVYAQPPASRHAPTHSHHAPMQTSKPGSITQGYPVQSNPNVQNPYPNRHRY